MFADTLGGLDTEELIPHIAKKPENIFGWKVTM